MNVLAGEKNCSDLLKPFENVLPFAMLPSKFHISKFTQLVKCPPSFFRVLTIWFWYKLMPLKLVVPNCSLLKLTVFLFSDCKTQNEPFTSKRETQNRGSQAKNLSPKSKLEGITVPKNCSLRFFCWEYYN